MRRWSDGNERKFLEEQGYSNICQKENNLCATIKFAFSTAIVSGLNENGYEDRWCYHDPHVAEEELKKWDGTGEPQRWHRHLPSMRRRDENNQDIGVW